MGRKPSTEPAAVDLVPRAWPLEDVPPALVSELAAMIGITGAHEESVAKALRARLDQPSHVLASLKALSPLALVVLEIVVELGGVATVALIGAMAAERTRTPSIDVLPAVAEIGSSALGVPLRVQQRGRDDAQAFGILAPAAKHIAPLVLGLTLPVTPPPDDAPAQSSEARRYLLAVLGLTAHRPLKFNADKTPNKGQLARFAKDLGPPPEELGLLVVAAAERGLLGARGDCYAPFGAKLLAEARATHPMDSWLPASGLASLESLVRAATVACAMAPVRILDERQLDGRGLRGYKQLHPSELESTRTSERARWLEAPGVEIVETAEGTWVRRRRRGGGDGHVTPSFDVLLGPCADPELIATVSLGAELKRIDRVLTFQITRAAVGEGLACGLSGEAFLEALGRVGRHGVPLNVATLVEEWIADEQPAVVDDVWLLRTTPEAADRIAKLVAEAVVARPAPGVLALSPELDLAAVSRAASDGGKVVARIEELREAIRARDTALSRRDWEEEEEPRHRPRGRWKGAPRFPDVVDEPTKPPPIPLVFIGPTELHARVARARTAGFRLEPLAAAHADGAREAPPPSAAAPRGAAPRANKLLNLARDTDVDDHLFELLHQIVSAHAESSVELSRWADRVRPAALQVRAKEFANDPLRAAGWLMLSRKARKEVLARTRTVEELFGEVDRFSSFGRLSPLGEELIGELDDLVSWASDEGYWSDVGEAARAPEPPKPDRADQAARQKPPVGAFPRDVPRVLSEKLERARGRAAPVDILVREGRELRVRTITPTAFQQRGSKVAVLAVDADTDEGRVYPLEDILGALSTNPS